MMRFNQTMSLRILWLGVGAVLALFWGEAFTRVLLPQNRDTILDILIPDEVVGYIYKPGASLSERGRDYDVPFVINSIGLRDREIGGKKDDVFRVLLMGNSFSVSHGVEIENSLSRAVERNLNALLAQENREMEVEVINGSNAGYNAYNYRKGFSRWRQELDPDLVLVGFVSPREIKCDDEDTRYLVKDGLLQGRYKAGETPPIVRKNPLKSARKFLARNSDYYVLLRNYFYYNEKMGRLLNREKTGNEALGQLKPFMTPQPPRITARFDRALSQLGKLKEEAGGYHIPVAVIAIPELNEVDPGQLRKLAEGAGVDMSGLDPTQPNRQLKLYCAETDIPLLDATGAVKSAHEQAPAFFMYDLHWNAHGIEAGAQSIAHQWLELGLAPFSAGDSRNGKTQ